MALGGRGLMKNSADRRDFPRWGLEEEVHCYLEGARWDCRSRDVSAGGIFLRTTRDIPIASTVALVFKPQAMADGEPVFLLGRVVRKQPPPEGGVGLRWEKAILDGPPEVLAEFLTTVMKSAASRIERKPVGRLGLVRSVYRFSVDSHPVDAPARSTDAPGPAPRRSALPVAGLTTTLEEVERLDVRVVSTSSLGVGAGAPSLPREGRAGDPDYPPGPITQRISHMDPKVPAGIGGLLDIAGSSYAVQIAFLGLKSMFVATHVVPVDRSAEVTISFGILTRGGVVQVRSCCRMLEVDDGTTTGTPGIELQMLSVDEAGHPGILKQYVKWLHFNALSAC